MREGGGRAGGREVGRDVLSESFVASVLHGKKACAHAPIAGAGGQASKFWANPLCPSLCASVPYLAVGKGKRARCAVFGTVLPSLDNLSPIIFCLCIH